MTRKMLWPAVFIGCGVFAIALGWSVAHYFSRTIKDVLVTNYKGGSGSSETSCRLVAKAEVEQLLRFFPKRASSYNQGHLGSTGRWMATDSVVVQYYDGLQDNIIIDRGSRLWRRVGEETIDDQQLSDQAIGELDRITALCKDREGKAER